VREYETCFIVQPEISDEGSEGLRSKLDGILESGSATRLMCEDLGKRKLAYEIRRFQKGHYYILSYVDGGGVVPGLERTLRLEESVLRFMTVQVADHVVDVDARLAAAQEVESAQAKRAEERAEREAEEARARAAAEMEAVARPASEAASEDAVPESVESATDAEAPEPPAAEAVTGDELPESVEPATDAEASAPGTENADAANEGSAQGEES